MHPLHPTYITTPPPFLSHLLSHLRPTSTTACLAVPPPYPIPPHLLHKHTPWVEFETTRKTLPAHCLLRNLIYVSAVPTHKSWQSRDASHQPPPCAPAPQPANHEPHPTRKSWQCRGCIPAATPVCPPSSACWGRSSAPSPAQERQGGVG